MSSVVSMDSEGIWNACTMNVIAKTAMTTVESKDWSEVSHESLGSAGAAGTDGCSGCDCSATLSGGRLNQRSLAQWDSRGDAPTPAEPPAARLAFSSKQRRGQRIQGCRRSGAGC